MPGIFPLVGELFGAQAPPAPESPEKTSDEESADRALVETCKKRLKEAKEAVKDQLDREDDDLTFDAVSQWPTDVKERRTSGRAPDGKSAPILPCFEVDQLDQPLQMVESEIRRAQIAVDVKPIGGGSTQDTADVIQGIVRKIERDSAAQSARLWAANRAAKCGRGFYRIRTEWEVEEVPEEGQASDPSLFDQKIVVERILDQGRVFCDPSAERQDLSDMEWAIIPTVYTETEYAREFGRSKLASATNFELDELHGKDPDWIYGEGGEKRFLVAEYYWREREQVRVIGDIRTGEAYREDSAPEELRQRVGQPGVVERTVDQITVQWATLNGVESLRRQEWPGRYIPIIRVIGKEYFADHESIFKGLITKAKDAQRFFNGVLSREAEQIWIASVVPYIMAAGQDEGFEAYWDNVNTHYYTRIPYKPVQDDQGRALPPPQRQVTEPQIVATMNAARELSHYIKSVTGRYGPSLGEPSRLDQSGIAIAELKAVGEVGTSVYMDNLADISVRYEARVVLDLIRSLYTRPGRRVRILGPENKESAVLLGVPYIVDHNDEPQQITPEQAEQLRQQGKADDVKFYDLRQGTYQVISSVGKSRDTLLDESRQTLLDVGKIWPEGFPIYADLFFRTLDLKGKEDIADRIERQNPAAQTPEQLKKLPPAVAAHVERLDGALKEAMATIQGLQQQIDTDAVKAANQRAIEQFKAEAQRELEAMKLTQKTAETFHDSETKRELAALKGSLDLILQELKHRHEREMQDDEQAHERGQRGEDRPAGRE